MNNKKHLAYGEKFSRGLWCFGCDAHFDTNINKRRERQETKRKIRNYLITKRDHLL